MTTYSQSIKKAWATKKKKYGKKKISEMAKKAALARWNKKK